jgi:presenilin-like A22 family membrane protease
MKQARQMPASWRRRLWGVRVAAPLLAVFAALLCLRAVLRHDVFYVGLNGGLLLANAVLSYVEWFVFQPEWPGRKLRL